jgi:hypothetical protein
LVWCAWSERERRITKKVADTISTLDSEYKEIEREKKFGVPKEKAP